MILPLQEVATDAWPYWLGTLVQHTWAIEQILGSLSKAYAYFASREASIFWKIFKKKKNSRWGWILNKLGSRESFSFGSYILGSGIAGKLKKVLTVLPATVKIKDILHTFPVCPAIICIISDHTRKERYFVGHLEEVPRKPCSPSPPDPLTCMSSCCVLSFGYFTPDASFDFQLNPELVSAAPVLPRRNQRARKVQ